MIEAFWDQYKGGVARQFFGNLREVKQRDAVTYVFQDLNAALSISAISPEIFRIRLSPHKVFLQDFSYAIAPYDFGKVVLTLVDDKEDYLLRTSVLELRLSKENFKITISDIATGMVMCDDGAGLSWEENPEHGGYFVYSGKTIQLDENFYGLGDKAADLNLIRKRFTNWSTDAYSFDFGTDPLYRNIPFYIGLHGQQTYGLFYDNTYRTHFDFGTDNGTDVTYIAEGGELNYYYIHGPHMMDVIKKYTNLTGTHPMPPLWALGFHQSRWSYFPEEKLLTLAKTFREKEIPCEALYLDIDYMDGYRCFTWNQDYFPDPKGMADKLSEMGFHLVTIVDPGIKIDGDYWLFREGREKGYFCRRGDDYFMEGPVWPGRCQFPDFTNPAVRVWWGDLFRHLLDAGVSGIWTDMNEPSIFGSGTFMNDVRHNYDGHHGSHRKAHNIYGMQMARATYNGLKKLQNTKRPFVITRSCYSGVQRYACFWTGDNVGTWQHLKLANIQCQRMSMSGLSFVGSDIGGFTGNADAELFIRWIQIGTFHPLMRAHSSGDTSEREPWSYGPDAEAIIKKFIELRYQLLPYLYSAFWENHKYGFPILRPVVMIEQEKNTNTYRQDEFVFGDKILVCPILDEGARGRVIYLPKGDWYNFWTNEVREGNQEQWVEAPIETIPLFVRAGAVIPMYPVVQNTRQLNLKELKLKIYHSTYTVNSFMYEDHGDTFAYQQDIYTEKHFVVAPVDGYSFSISQKSTGMFTPSYDMYAITITGFPHTVVAIMADGQNLNGGYKVESNSDITFKVLKSITQILVVGKMVNTLNKV